MPISFGDNEQSWYFSSTYVYILYILCTTLGKYDCTYNSKKLNPFWSPVSAQKLKREKWREAALIHKGSCYHCYCCIRRCCYHNCLCGSMAREECFIYSFTWSWFGKEYKLGHFRSWRGFVEASWRWSQCSELVEEGIMILDCFAKLDLLTLFG